MLRVFTLLHIYSFQRACSKNFGVLTITRYHALLEIKSSGRSKHRISQLQSYCLSLENKFNIEFIPYNSLQLCHNILELSQYFGTGLIHHKLKQNLLSSKGNFVYVLTHELTNEFRLIKIKNLKNYFKIKSQLSLESSLLSRIKILAIMVKN